MSRIGKLTRLDALIALFLGTAFVVLLLQTIGQLGYARDESFYYFAANVHGRWLEELWASPAAAVNRKAVDAAWSYNHEHPGLIKTLFALSSLILQKKLHLFSMAGTSYRFPAMVLAGGLISLVYVWGAQARSRVTGLVAAAVLASMPRFFFHAHLACFDVPVVALWTLAAYTFWRSVCAPGPGAAARSGADAPMGHPARLARALKWPVLSGVSFGLVLDTKHNSWFFPIAAVAFSAVVLLFPRLVGPAPSRDDARSERMRILMTLGAMAIVGPLVLVALWPWLWYDTAARISEYVHFQLNHVHYNIEFLGQTYWKPPMPRTYALIMTVATVPLVTLLLAGAGLAGRIRARLSNAKTAGPDKLGPDGRTALLWLFSILVIYAAWLSPQTPIFGGTKHWMTAYPFVALFAGTGADDVLRTARMQLVSARRRLPVGVLSRLRSGAHRQTLVIGLSLLVCGALLASPIVQTARSHPWGLSSYTPLVGGPSGAASLGLNRTFWGYTTGVIAEELNTAPPGTRVYIHDNTQLAWDMMVADGRIDKHIRGIGSIDASTMALYHHETHMLGIEYQIWVAYGTRTPEIIAGLDGVPVILVYKRPER